MLVGYDSAVTPTNRESPPTPRQLGEFATLLARAVRQFHTYPPKSSQCVDAVAACHQALVSDAERSLVVLRVRPHHLIVEEIPIGAGTIVEHELARRLHRAHVSALAVDCTASPTDLSGFCRGLIQAATVDSADATLAEILAERGVDRIMPVMTLRAEVFDLGLPEPRHRALMQLERSRAAARSDAGAASYLYPPDRGWVRLDPSVGLEAVSLADLAILVDDPRELASVLLRLTGDAALESTALEQKFTDVSTLYASLSPNLARVLLSKLARAVLTLDSEHRHELLRRTILPGLLDGRADGSVLEAFPDVELAESLCLLLDLETAAPEVLDVAMARLNLPVERLHTLVPLLDAAQERHRAGASPHRAPALRSLEDHAHRLLLVSSREETSFAAFTGFDLSMNDDVRRDVSHLRDGIETTNAATAQLECFINLVRVEPNPDLVRGFLRQISTLLAELEYEERWSDVAMWWTRVRQTVQDFEESRPDVVEAISSAMTAFYSRERVVRLRSLYHRDDAGRDVAGAVLESAGPEIGPALIALLDSNPSTAEKRATVHMMCDHATTLAPALVSALESCRNETRPLIAEILGYAGPEAASAVAALLDGRDMPTVRAAARALARIGTAEAVQLVGARVLEGPAHTRPIAEDALWTFPKDHACGQAVRLLAQSAFVYRHPRSATRLLDRVMRTSPGGAVSVLPGLTPLCLRVWNPGLVRLGLTARRYARKGRG